MNITHGGCAIFSYPGLVRLREYKYQRLGDFHVETIGKGFFKDSASPLFVSSVHYSMIMYQLLILSFLFQIL